ncbi:SGNH/GDSL hydrolase family protein [Zavarzinia sp. CC-PAN008]|uniref:SGNH/GDSL hydrolase family protein n=1 Tax=Zavarzinia sp. CC-PAN008 TaxID=3243332 RepID=UPI003F7423D7
MASPAPAASPAVTTTVPPDPAASSSIPTPAAEQATPAEPGVLVSAPSDPPAPAAQAPSASATPAAPAAAAAPGPAPAAIAPDPAPATTTPPATAAPAAPPVPASPAAAVQDPAPAPAGAAPAAAPDATAPVDAATGLIEAPPSAPPATLSRPIRVAVYGDSLANGMFVGLYRAVKGDPRIELLQRTKSATGIVRPDVYDWNNAVEQSLEKDQVDAAIILIGTNDKQNVALEDRRVVKFGTDEWRDIYGGRVARLYDSLTSHKVEVFWVGLPIMRAGGFSDGMAVLNAIYEDQAKTHGATYIPLWPLSADESGAFASHGPDLAGRTRRLRDNDGIHFTTPGYELMGKRIMETVQARLFPGNQAGAGP